MTRSKLLQRCVHKCIYLFAKLCIYWPPLSTSSSKKLLRTIWDCLPNKTETHSSHDVCFYFSWQRSGTPACTVQESNTEAFKSIHNLTEHKANFLDFLPLHTLYGLCPRIPGIHTTLSYLFAFVHSLLSEVFSSISREPVLYLFTQLLLMTFLLRSLSCSSKSEAISSSYKFLVLPSCKE